MPQPFTSQLVRILSIVLLVIVMPGCRLFQSNKQSEYFAAPVSGNRLPHPNLEKAERAYAAAVEQQRLSDSRCLDGYVECCRLLWPQVSSSNSSSLNWEVYKSRPHHLYRSAVGRYLLATKLTGPQSASSKITDRISNIKVRMNSASWSASDLTCFYSIPNYKPPHGTTPIAQPGVGLPVLAEHHSNYPFVPKKGICSLNVMIRPGDQGKMILDITDPLTASRSLNIGHRTVPLAFDLTAPSYYLSKRYSKNWVEGFFSPGQDKEHKGLLLLNPYQKGKIPVVFVHGIASNSVTWIPMTNQLASDPEVMKRYQFLFFSYPTGEPFPIAATLLRKQLRQFREQVDPSHADAALDNMVVVGHSMGGLVAKLQITSSGQGTGGDLWKSVSKERMPLLSLPTQTKKLIQDNLVFQASRDIKRVIFIGTPHKGSWIASNPVGRTASRFVKTPQELKESVANLQTLSFSQPVPVNPNSVQLLRPNNPLLKSIFHLPIDPNIEIHNIIGTGYRWPLSGNVSDGVVLKSSASHPGAVSEHEVDSGHLLHQHPDTFKEVKRILIYHYAKATQPRIPAATDRNITAEAQEIPPSGKRHIHR